MKKVTFLNNAGWLAVDWDWRLSTEKKKLIALQGPWPKKPLAFAVAYPVTEVRLDGPNFLLKVRFDLN